MKLKHCLPIVFLMAVILHPAWAEKTEKAVKITRDLSSVTVMHHGQPVTIERNQNSQNKIVDDYALTSRPCPPFCVQPMQLLPGVRTIGEIEMLDFLKRASQEDSTVLVIDSRTSDWVEKGTIPGSVNIPWTQLYRGSENYESFLVESTLTDRFGATVQDGIWDFRPAKELVFFCNGPWCGQSPTNIRELVSMGYPAHKLFWYRGGMQSWQAFGLTTVKP